MPLSKYDKLSEQEKNLLRDLNKWSENLNNQLEQEIIDWVIKNKVSLKQAKNIVSSGFGTEYLITVLDKLIDDENFKF
jgi:hydroxylamine reductase (hybrid-cluster protein)